MTETRFRTRWGAVALAALMLLAVAPVGADTETQDPATAQTDAAEPPTVSDAITVTAQKREESVQDVPSSVTALSAEKIEMLATGGADVRFLNARVPSLQLESSFGRVFPRFYIRGLGNSDFDLNASQPVSMIVDEVVLENPMVKAMPLFDIDRVEVLRGPQGTLFGRNTPAGIVKFETNRPTREKEASIRLSYGTFDNFDGRVVLSGPISDTLAARFSLLTQYQSDWVDNKAPGGSNNELGGYDIVAWRLQFLWEPNERFDALVNFHGSQIDGTARIFRANVFNKGSNRLVGGFKQETVFFDGLNEQQVDALGGVLRLEYDLGNDLTLTSVTGIEKVEMFSRGDIDGGYGAVFAPPSGPGVIAFPAESADGIPDLDQFTQEIRIASDTGGEWDWLAGIYFFDEDLTVDSFNYDSLADNASAGLATQSQDAKSWALFGSVDYRPNDDWTFKGGLRYTDEEKDFVAERPEPVFQPPLVRPITVSTGADLITWDLTATRHVSETMNVYGRVGTGFRAPSIQGRILFCPDFDGGTSFATNCVSVAGEEEILSTELGMKAEFMERRVRLNLAIYDFEVTDQQVSAVGGQFNTATLLNAKQVDGYGLEADLEIAPSQYWRITLGGSYNKTKINDPSLAVAPCGGGCTVTDPLNGDSNALIHGNSLPHAPELSLSGILDYRKPVSDGLFMASVDFAYHDDKHFFLYDTKEFVADSTEIGGRIGYIFPGGQYELALWGRNLLDEVVVQGGIDFNNLTGMTNEPRKIGVEFVTRFGK